MAKKRSSSIKKKSQSSYTNSIIHQMKNAKIEFLIIIVLLVSFLLWAASKCSTTKQQVQADEQAANTAVPIVQDTTPSNIARIDLDKLPQSESSVPPPSDVISDSYTTLYVTIDGLKMRKKPQLNSDILTTLNLHDRVKFLNERTDFRQKINIGTEYAYEPWVFVQYRGQNGWVYGAGVHYQKWDRLKEQTTMPVGEVEE